MESGEKKVITRRSITKIARNGNTRRLTAPRESPEMAAEDDQADAHGRRQHADGQVGDHDDPQMHRIDAQGPAGMAAIMGTSRISAAVVSTTVPAARRMALISSSRATGWVVQPQQAAGDGCRDLFDGGDPAKDRGGGDNEHDHRRGDRPFEEYLHQIFWGVSGGRRPCSTARGVDHGHRRRFRGGEDAQKNAAENDDRRPPGPAVPVERRARQRQERKGPWPHTPACRPMIEETMINEVPMTRARQDAGGKEPADGGPGEKTEDDHGNGRG